MNRYLESSNKSECCGCGACVAACPVSCIKMGWDADGFIFPQINDVSKCIDCKLCQKVCPIEDPFVNQDSGQYYGAYSKNDELIRKCSSGGIFAEIASLFLQENGVVFGAAFNNEWKLSHRCYTKDDDVSSSYSSKYLQSDLKDTYLQCKKLLVEGKKVLFSGTPCQISGLHRFLRKDYDNLFTVDVICHGVPSESIFHAYVASLEKKHKGVLSYINFRDKSRNGWSITLRYIINRKGNKRTFDLSRRESSYFTFFLKGMIARESCYTCPFSSMNRPGDLTLGDFWGYQNTRPELKHEQGLSVTLSNTDKGERMVHKLQQAGIAVFNKVSEESIRLSENKNLYKPTKRAVARDTIYHDLRVYDYSYLENKYFQAPTKISAFYGKMKDFAKKFRLIYGK